MTKAEAYEASACYKDLIMTRSVVEELAALVSEGPATLLFQAEEALSIDERLGSAADAINGSKFKNCLVAFQSYAIEQFVLAVTKLYEQPTSRYELRSAPAVLTFHGEARRGTAN